jgi:protein MpaA
MFLTRPKLVPMVGAIVLVTVVAVVVPLLAEPAAAARDHAARASARTLGIVAPAQATPLLRRFTIGHSVRGRRIDAYEIAAPGAMKALLVFGCIHGDEPAGIAIARRLLKANPAPGSALWVVPNLNPDGVAAGTRANAQLVDLNRNFPWHWRPLGPPGDLHYAGPGPLSEPESRAAHSLILRVRPRITIWFHQHADLVDLSGGDPRIERRFAHLVGLPVVRLQRYPGTATSWSNSILPGTTAFVVELPGGSLSVASVARYAHAVLTLAAEAR